MLRSVSQLRWGVMESVGVRFVIQFVVLCFVFFVLFFFLFIFFFFFFQAEDGIRDLVRSRGLGDVYKRQEHDGLRSGVHALPHADQDRAHPLVRIHPAPEALQRLSLIHI